MDIPCGKCYDCLQRRISGWSYRLTNEGRNAHTAFFVTLTYNEKTIPMTPKGFMTLDKTHLQNFFKRLRKYERKSGNKRPLRYYACGEYGSKKFRPHYHLILYNASALGIEQCWGLEGRPIGDIHIDQVNGATIGYTLKYMCKSPENVIPKHKNDDRKPIFALMSKGLGKDYLGTFEKVFSKEITVTRTSKKTGKTSVYQRKVYKSVLSKKSAAHKWHHTRLDERMHIPIEDGKRIAMPRYYKNKIYTDSERNYIGNQMAKLPPRFDNEADRVQQVQANSLKMKNPRITEKL